MTGVFTHAQDLPTTGMGWAVQPDGLRSLLRRIDREYTGPAEVALFVTENGAAYDDVVGHDGLVHDDDRVAYVRAHLDAIAGALDDGVPVRGFFYWSLLDNFEWAWGYAKRFGLVRVDYATQVRTVKDSGWAYARAMATRQLAPVPEDVSLY